MKIALLTCTTWQGLFEKEQVFAQKLSLPNTQIDVVAWDDETTDWTTYDYLIFRTTWDYYYDPQKFDAWLQKIQDLGIKTLNPVHTIRRNQHKFYLQDLQNKGIDIIPTIFIPKNTPLDLNVLQEHNWQKAIIKPAVSAGSFCTKLFDSSESQAIFAEYSDLLQERDLLLQPFLPQIQTDGEISILFFNGKYSHAIVKTPVEGDFRIQVQYGGKYQIYEPSQALIATAQNIVKTFDDDLLYARVDGILHEGKFLLMELELIEPDLYFTTHHAAEPNFIAALAARLTSPIHTING